MTAQRALTLAGLTIGVAVLVLEYALQISARGAGGDSLLGATLHTISFFTIVSNLAVVLVYAASLHRGSSLRWFREPITRGTAAAMITLVMLVYLLILARTENPQGWAKLSAVAAHYVAPPLYLAWWALFVRHGVLELRGIPRMLVPSLLYMAYVLVRGGIAGRYPYAMLDPNRIGAGAVALNAFAMLIALAALCAAVVALDRRLARASPSGNNRPH